MHAVEIINYRNAKECGISVEQNRQEALEGQYIRQSSRPFPQGETQADAAPFSGDACSTPQIQENPQ